MSSAESISQSGRAKAHHARAQASAKAAHMPQHNPTSLESLEAERQIEAAITQLIAGDFHSKWDSTKQFNRQFAQWGDRPIPYLIRLLENSTDTENQWFLVRVLAQFDHPRVVEALAQLLVITPAEDLQLEVIKALTRLGNSAIATLADLLDSHQPLKRRILAAQALARIRRSATISPLLGIAGDADPQLRAIAIEALGSFHDPQITPVLLAALEDAPPVCTEAIRTLGRRVDLLATVDLIGPLQHCLHREEEVVAQESAVALGRLGSEAGAIALGELLTQPAPTAVKIAAVRALGWMNTLSAIDHLTTAFNCGVPVVMPVVQQEIAKSLGQTRSAQFKATAAQPLLTWIQNIRPTNRPGPDDPLGPVTFGIKQAVISALARLSDHSGDSAAIDSLVPLLGDADSRIRLHALSALKQIDPKAAQTKVQAYLQNEHTAPDLKAKVASTLAAW